jgi:DNA-binding NarL/FixJ family response regulator
MPMHDHPSASARRTPTSAGAPSPAWNEEVDPAEAWHVLMSGGWTVGEHALGLSGGTMVARLVPPQSSGETLTTEEIRVAASRVRGASIKALAIEMGWTYGAVAECIANVMRKLKLRSQAQLVVLFHQASAALSIAAQRPEDVSYLSAPRGLTATRIRYDGGDYLVLRYPAPRWSLPPSLSKTEQRIVLELIAGASQHAIALDRGTAARTVANQVASIYRKLKVHSRIELFVALRAP